MTMSDDHEEITLVRDVPTIPSKKPRLVEGYAFMAVVPREDDYSFIPLEEWQVEVLSQEECDSSRFQYQGHVTIDESRCYCWWDNVKMCYIAQSIHAG